MKMEIDVLYAASNVFVFQTTMRRYPSIAIQGDTLALLTGKIQRVKEVLEAGKIGEEELYDLDYVASVLLGLNEIYRKYASGSTGSIESV